VEQAGRRLIDELPGSLEAGGEGIGKTSLLNFLRKELRSADPDPWAVVTFNAWQHQRMAPPWWWLTMALYQQGSREPGHISTCKALRFRCREWLIGQAVVASTAAGRGPLLLALCGGPAKDQPWSSPASVDKGALASQA
jgi:hypothetical protein